MTPAIIDHSRELESQLRSMPHLVVGRDARGTWVTTQKHLANANEVGYLIVDSRGEVKVRFVVRLRDAAIARAQSVFTCYAWVFGALFAAVALYVGVSQHVAPSRLILSLVLMGLLVGFLIRGQRRHRRGAVQARASVEASRTEVVSRVRTALGCGRAGGAN